MYQSQQRNTLVSVIITNYNYGQFLEQAIESALMQTYPHTEVIVVDDGSTDNSREVIVGYRDRVRTIFKENGGMASALNAGFALSRGDVIIFLDADDVLLPNAIDEVMAVWRPELAKVQWRLQLVTDRLELLPATWPVEKRLPFGSVRESALRWDYYPSPPMSGNAFSRWLLEKIFPIPEDKWRVMADNYLLTLSALYGEIWSIDKVLGYYRVHGKNLTHSSGRNTSNVLRKLIQELEIYLERQRLLRETTSILGLSFKPFLIPLVAKTLMALSLLNRDALSNLGLSANRVGIALRGIYASAVYPYMPSFFSRVRLSTWFLLAGILPLPLAKKVALWGVLPSTRPKWLARALRASEL